MLVQNAHIHCFDLIYHVVLWQSQHQLEFQRNYIPNFDLRSIVDNTYFGGGGGKINKNLALPYLLLICNNWVPPQLNQNLQPQFRGRFVLINTHLMGYSNYNFYAESMCFHLPMIHYHVQIGCLHEKVTSLSTKTTLGENQITKAYNSFPIICSAYSSHNENTNFAFWYCGAKQCGMSMIQRGVT